MSNGTGTSYKAGSMGSIKDLLMQAKNSGNGLMPLRIGDDDTKLETEIPDQTVDASLDDSDCFSFVSVETEKDAAGKEKVNETQTTQTRTPAAPSPSLSQETQKNENNKTQPKQEPKQEAKTKRNKSDKSDKPSARQYRKGSFKEIGDRIDNFDPKAEDSKRHWVYIPAKVAAILYFAYGERKLSAVLSTLAKDHINTFKGEIKEIIDERSDLLSEQDK